MYDHENEILELYGLNAKATKKGRGALLCDTEDGLKCIREYWGSPVRLERQKKLLSQCRDNGFFLVDMILENKEGKLISTGEDGTPYVVRDWFYGRECDTRSKEDIKKSMNAMADLHKVLKDETEGTEGNLLEECVRHNNELRSIRRYLKNKKKKNHFEEILSASMDFFISRGEDAAEKIRQSGYLQMKEGDTGVCHGECSQHNIIFTQKGVAFVNFDHCKKEVQTADLCQFMRKILEKNHWDPGLGNEMIKAYMKKRTLSKKELLNLELQLSYPWRYWKIANYYTGSNKAWVSRKNVEKLEQTIELSEEWIHFLKDFTPSSLL